MYNGSFLYTGSIMKYNYNVIFAMYYTVQPQLSGSGIIETKLKLVKIDGLYYHFRKNLK